MNITWSKTYVVEPTPKDLDSGDKIILPSSALEELLAAAANNSENLPSPLTFELRHPHTRTIVYGGVKEFSGQTGVVQLPAWMFETLQVEHNAKVAIKLCTLPKGTWARLQPMTPDVVDIIDYRAALESHLRAHYNTMAKGQILACRYGSRSYPFLVTDLKPEAAVCITDTDLEVDLEPLEQEQQRQTHREKGTIVLDEPVTHIKIENEQYRYWEVQLKDHAAVRIQMTVESGDTDLVVSRTDQRPTIDNHEWSDLSSDTNRDLVIPGTASLSRVYIGIHAVSSDAVVSWEAISADGSEMDGIEDEPHAHEAGYTRCKNCNTWVPERSNTLHESFCLRNNVVCPHGCGRVFKKGSPELENHWHCTKCNYVGTRNGQKKHIDYFHVPKTCICGDFVTNSYEELARHRQSMCSERLITCRYCHNLVPQGIQSLEPRDRLLNLHSHESYCGSRTITCQKCKKQIPIKDIQVHAKVHEVQRQNQRLPPLCSNRNCIRPRVNNRLRLCQYCFGPFWVTDDDPKNVKLLQRVARKLHSQLTVGCGHSYCRNKYCATSIQTPQDANTAATTLIPLIQSLQRQLTLPDPDPELYLCVDESTTRRRLLAEMLEEGTTRKYSIAWCSKALDSENEDLERAQHWLDANAPRQHVTV
ncbi:ubiquitin fusion degradation protein UFD1-domain-containing protein [Dichotomocladium elegans]|nr:ubiquitin fusion degradation protein UFD1-domain-containing protein [Dichotomocladium elegans]